MRSNEMYDYLLRAKDRNAALIVTFDDSDRYLLNDVDLCFSSDHDGSRETEPLVVDFENCLTDSKKRIQAYRDGELKTNGVYWTSQDPIMPVMMQYEIEDVAAIWDDNKNYYVFERSDPD